MEGSQEDRRSPGPAAEHEAPAREGARGRRQPDPIDEDVLADDGVRGELLRAVGARTRARPIH